MPGEIPLIPLFQSPNPLPKFIKQIVGDQEIEVGDEWMHAR
jgi:hypothetical protein